MGHSMILALGLRGLGAFAWFGYFWALARILPPPALGHTLYALALAGIAAALASAGWTQLVIRDGSRAKAKNHPAKFADLIHHATKGALWRVSLAAIALLAIAGIGMLPPTIPSLPFAILTCAIAAALALIQIKSSAQRANDCLGRALLGQGVFPAALPLGLFTIATLFMPSSALLVLVFHFLSLVFILIWLGRDLPKIALRENPVYTLRALSFGQAGQVLLSHMDVLVLGWIISPTEAGIYLIARRLAGVVGLAFDALRSAAAPPLAVAFDRGTARPLATRINRIFLLVGVISGGFLWLCAPFILPIFGAINSLTAFHGLLLGALAPAIFGATGLLLVMGNLELGRARLVLSLLPVSLISLLWSGGFGIAGLGFAAGSMQLILGAGGAVLLMRHHGIRPGALPSQGGLHNVSRAKHGQNHLE